MGIWKGRAAAAAVGLGLCLGLIGASPALAAEPGGISGRVVDAEEAEGLNGAEVCAEAGFASSTPKVCVETGSTEAGSGFYLISGLEPGQYRVHFVYPDPRYVPKYFLDTYRPDQARFLEIEAGSVKSGISAALERKGWVTGRAADAAGNALGDVEVCIPNVLEPEGAPLCAQTEVTGKYLIEEVPPGLYRATFTPPAGHDIFPAESDDFLVEGYNETPNVDATMELGLTIEGAVSEAGSGTPLPGIRVCALAPGSEAEVGCALSDAVGDYAIHGLHVGSYVVGFSVQRSEGGVPSEPEDGFVRQYYEDKPSFAAATVLNASVPGRYQDVDGHLSRGAEAFPVAATGGGSAPTPWVPPGWPGPTSPKPQPKPKLHCRKHFHKKRVKGKQRCVRVHRHKRR
jgi:hypothetical protein